MKANHPSRRIACPPRASRSRLMIFAACLLLGLVQQASAQSWSLTNVWFDTNGIGHLANSANNRGVAYSVSNSQGTNQVFVSTRLSATTSAIDVFDGGSGSLLSGANGVTGANTGIDQIGVGDDGILYGAPLATAVATGAPFTVYSWTNWNSAPYIAYSSTNANDPLILLSGSKRVGDSLAVTGSGTNTLILAAVAGGCTNFALLHTSDGVNFGCTLVSVSTGLPSTSGNILGITFYTNNTFLVQPGSGASSRNVYLVSYPTNFASVSNVNGTVLGSAAGLSAGNDEFLNYAPGGQMLASLETLINAGSPCTVGLYSTTNYPANLNPLSSTSFATPTQPGNATGGVALGGQGKTNYLYALETADGLEAYKIVYSMGPVGPTLGTPTGGLTNAYPPQTLTVTVTSGTPPFHYQWYVISNNVTNLIAGANTNTYTVTATGTNFYFVVVTNAASSGNIVTSAVVGMTLLAPVVNPVVTNLWSLPIGAYSFLANDNNSRGIAYDTNLNVVVVADSSPVSLNLLNGDTGTSNGNLSTAGLPSNNQFVVDQVGVADDGAVYAGALYAASGQVYSLSRYPAATNSAVATLSYQGDPGSGSGDRWGDTMAVRGGGTNTQLLLGANASANVVIFTTHDGATFSPTLMTIAGASPAFAAKGVAFGAGNTFWAKNYGGNLYEIAYDPVAMTNAVLFNYSISGQIPSRMVGLAVDMTNNILTGVNLLDENNDLQFYQLTGSANPPVLFDQDFFPSYNVNGNDNAAVVMKTYRGANRVYALDVNNGIVAAAYGLPSSTVPAITSEPSSETVFSADPSINLAVGVSGSLPIYYQWQRNGTNIPNATNSTLTLTNLSTNNSGSYDVIIHNIAGSQTSSPPSVVTIYPPVTSPNVTQLWNVPPGLTNYPYLDATSYSARGMAYDTNTQTVLVCNNGSSSPSPTTNLGLYALDANTGSNLFALNTAGLNNTGLLFDIDQVGVGDDGVVYAANCVAAGSAVNFTVYYWTSVSTGAGQGYALLNTDPGKGSGDRWGDTMAVRGAGVNTQILLGSYYGFDAGPATNASLLTTQDGTDFTPVVINVTNVAVPAGFSMLGVAFGAGNTIWTKSPGYNLRQIAFDPVTGNASVIQNIAEATSGYSSFANLGGICLDVPNNLLAGIAFSDIPANVSFYQLSATPPYLFDQSFFPLVEANGQNNGVTSVKGNRVYALDCNNGVIAFTYTVPPAPPTLTSFSITHVSNTPGSGVTLTWQSIPTFTYQVQVASVLSGTTTWVNLGNPIVATGTTTSYTDTTAPTSGPTSYYQVIAY